MIVVITSGTSRHTFRIAGPAAQSAPASVAAASALGISTSGGRCGHVSETSAAPRIPARSCPSAPMFQMPQRNAIAMLSPVITSGPLLIRVSARLAGEPTAPDSTARSAARGSPPRTQTMPATSTDVRSRTPIPPASARRVRAARSRGLRMRFQRVTAHHETELLPGGVRRHDAYQLALVENAHAVGDRDHLYQLGGDEQDRGAARALLPDLVVDVSGGIHVQAAGGV